MEYRGYDSAGLEIEGDEPGKPLIFKEVGKVGRLRQHCLEAPDVNFDKKFLSQTSIAHTRFVVTSHLCSCCSELINTRDNRWATHGAPSSKSYLFLSSCAQSTNAARAILALNCHPHVSDPLREFTVVHNGIITNCTSSHSLDRSNDCSV